MAFTEQQFRDVLGRFATGITVVTCLGRLGEHIGVTINSFNSVSLHPPMVLFSLGRAAMSFDDVRMADHLVINVLELAQEPLSRRFAEPGGNKWRDVEFHLSSHGCPVLAGNLATLECRPIMHHEGGDHLIIVSEVQQLSHAAEGRPLIYYRGDYTSLEERAFSEDY